MARLRARKLRPSKGLQNRRGSAWRLIKRQRVLFDSQRVQEGMAVEAVTNER